MFINSLLSCFILLSSSVSNQCITADENKKTQTAQRAGNEYMPAVIYFNSQELSMIDGLREIIKIDLNDKEEEPIVQTFVIER